MTSAIAINRRPRVTWVTPLSSVDRKRVAAICNDEKIIVEIERLRACVAVTPDHVAARDLLKTLATLADKLNAAGDALETLPTTGRALLQEKLGGTQAQQYDLAMTLYNVAGCAGAATLRVAPKSGRPADRRVVDAVTSASALCESFRLPVGKVPELASLIFGAEILPDACKRALRWVRKPT